LKFAALPPTLLAFYNTYLFITNSNPENYKHWICFILLIIAALIFATGFYLVLYYNNRENSAYQYLMQKMDKVTDNGKYSWSNKTISPRLMDLFRKLYQNPNMTEEEVTRKLEQVADYQQKHGTNGSK
jgi:uncharacterized protein HemX